MGHKDKVLAKNVRGMVFRDARKALEELANDELVTGINADRSYRAARGRKGFQVASYQNHAFKVIYNGSSGRQELRVYCGEENRSHVEDLIGELDQKYFRGKK